uniref:TIGR04002 family protein n=1 Tax=Agathobacter sp. TaxID=2021311 RepID=UPI00405750AB
MANMSTTTNTTNSRTQIHLLSTTAIFAALITIMTAYVCHIPVPIAGGYLHFGDSLIYLAAAVLPRPYAFAAAAIGGGMADLLTAPMWTLPTVLIKMLITLPFTNKGKRIITPRNMFAPVLAYVISGTGYFLANNLLFGAGVAFFTSFMASAIQSFGSAAAFIAFGSLLDKARFKNRFKK